MGDVLSTVVRGARRLRGAQRTRARARVRLITEQTQTREPEVLVLVPDHDLPSAGIRTMYRHVDILGSAGIPARVLHHAAGFSCTWFEHETPVTDLASRPVGPDDLLVVGERDVDVVVRHVAAGGSVRHVVLDQSGYLAWEHSPDEVARHYASAAGPLAVLATSTHVAEVVRFAHPGLEVRHVRLGLDPTRFHPADREPADRPLQLSYMPRRGADDAALVLRLLAERDVLEGVDVRELGGLSTAGVADALRRTDVFLGISHREGFGMPLLEAMACGAYVVGYDALGGKEFLHPSHSTPVETGNVLALASAVADALAHEREAPGWLRRRGLAAAALAHDQYSPARERESVLSAYAGLLAPTC